MFKTSEKAKVVKVIPLHTGEVPGKLPMPVYTVTYYRYSGPGVGVGTYHSIRMYLPY